MAATGRQGPSTLHSYAGRTHHDVALLVEENDALGRQVQHGADTERDGQGPRGGRPCIVVFAGLRAEERRLDF